MKRKGIKVLALLPWYSRDTSGWSAYVTRQVQATPTVPAWEITNEPEMTWWGGPISPANYMNMLRVAHSIIKAANRDALLVGPAIGATPEGVAIPVIGRSPWRAGRLGDDRRRAEHCQHGRACENIAFHSVSPERTFRPMRLEHATTETVP
jgi:hypothetical protein